MPDAQALRVLLVTQQLRSVRSGVGTYARTLVDGLCARGLRPTLASWDDECDRDRHPAVDWWPLGARPRLDPTPGAFVALGRRAATGLRRAAAGFDVVHFLDAREGHAAVGDPAARARGRRFVGTVHDDYAARAPRSPLALRHHAGDPWRRWAYYTWLRRLERRTLPRFDVLGVNSAATLASLRAVYGVDPARCTVVPLTIAPPPAVAPAALDGVPKLLFVGGNFFRKGLDAVVDALPVLLTRYPELRLHVAGHDPAGRLLRRRAERLGVTAAITWHGRVAAERCAALFRAADALVVPSRSEALGLVYLEAFAADLPVVAGLAGGVAELVRDGVSGLATATDAASIAGALTRLFEDRALRERVVAGGRRLLATRTFDALIDSTLASYDLNRRRPSG